MASCARRVSARHVRPQVLLANYDFRFCRATCKGNAWTSIQSFHADVSFIYQKRRVGDLMAHATNDLSAVQQTAGAGVLTLVD